MTPAPVGGGRQAQSGKCVRERTMSMATAPIADGSSEPLEGLPEGAARGSQSLSRRRPASRPPNPPEARDGRTQSSFSLRTDA